MSRFYSARVYKLTNFLFNGDSATTVLGNPFLIRYFCVNSATEKTSFTVSYLIKAYGFQEEKAISALKKIQLKSSSNPDTVLTLFRNHEFPNDAIIKIIEQRPELLLSDVDKILSPKIELLRSLGFSGRDLAKLLAVNPSIFTNSLERRIIPCVDFLKRVLPTRSDVLTVIKRSPWMLGCDPLKILEPNIVVLQSHGVPISNILKVLVYYPNMFTRSKGLKAKIEEAKRMQIDPSKYVFVTAVNVLASQSKSSWEAKIDMYKKWGWSDEDILSAFRKEPHCMMKSKKKVKGCMEFLVNKLGYDSLIIAKNPSVLMYSLEERIIPRLSVIHALISHGLVKKDCSIITVMKWSEEAFLKKFVTEFQSQVPQLLDIYKGKKNAH